MSTSRPVDDCCRATGPGRPAGEDARRRAAPLFRLLGDPTRLEILALIASREEPVCVCEIVGCFELSQPTISHHLKLLREAALVVSERRGTWSFYSLDPRGAEALEAAFDCVPRHVGAPAPTG